MSFDHPNGIESSVSKNTKQRRTFLKRATAGAAIASIPGRSAWAGIAGSIVASGHGSDWNGGKSIRLLSHGIWKQRLDPARNNGNRGTHRSDNVQYSLVFGGNPIGGPDASFFEILNGSAASVDFQIVAMYLNAKYSGTLGLDYPVVYSFDPSITPPFDSLTAYADKLYELATLSGSSLSSELGKLIEKNHV